MTKLFNGKTPSLAVSQNPSRLQSPDNSNDASLVQSIKSEGKLPNYFYVTVIVIQSWQSTEKKNYRQISNMNIDAKVKY